MQNPLAKVENYLQKDNNFEQYERESRGALAGVRKGRDGTGLEREIGRRGSFSANKRK